MSISAYEVEDIYLLLAIFLTGIVDTTVIYWLVRSLKIGYHCCGLYQICDSVSVSYSYSPTRSICLKFLNARGSSIIGDLRRKHRFLG